MFAADWRERLAEREKTYKKRWAKESTGPVAPPILSVGPSQPRINEKFPKGGEMAVETPKLPTARVNMLDRGVPAGQQPIRQTVASVNGRVVPVGGTTKKSKMKRIHDMVKDTAKYKDTKKYKQPTMEAFFGK